MNLPQVESAASVEITEDSFPLLSEITDLNQREKKLLQARLKLETRDIIKMYWKLVNTFRKSLKNRNFPLDELISYLKMLEAYDPVKEVLQEQRVSVFEEHLQQLKNATSLSDIFDVVEKYCSFFNYDIIKNMIEDFGTDNDKKELLKYIREFNQYAKRRIYECPSNFTKGKEEGARLHLKLDSKYDERNLSALEEFQVSLCKILKVSVNSLLLCRLDAGCIEVEYQIPAFLQRGAFPLTSEQETALSDLGVLNLFTAGYHLSVSVFVHQGERGG